MIKIENVALPSSEQWDALIRGMRNPLNSWSRTDSSFNQKTGEYKVGNNDLGLMNRLTNSGNDHGKFMRMITVYMDITAPLYWWKETDTYKVGTVANSCSTMHKIQAKEFTLDDFSHEHLNITSTAVLEHTIDVLNLSRDEFLKTEDKDYWWQMIQLLPSSYNQKRTMMLNYQVLKSMYHSRKNHKLNEWREFCKWIETLPYSELITN